MKLSFFLFFRTTWVQRPLRIDWDFICRALMFFSFLWLYVLFFRFPPFYVLGIKQVPWMGFLIENTCPVVQLKQEGPSDTSSIQHLSSGFFFSSSNKSKQIGSHFLPVARMDGKVTISIASSLEFQSPFCGPHLTVFPWAYEEKVERWWNTEPNTKYSPQLFPWTHYNLILNGNEFDFIFKCIYF